MSKSKEYQRIGYKEELEEPIINTLIKNPIIIKINTPNIEYCTIIEILLPLIKLFNNLFYLW